MMTLLYTSCIDSHFVLSSSKMINLSQPDTIDERVINTKKLATFTMTVSNNNTIQYLFAKAKQFNVKNRPLLVRSVMLMHLL